MRAIVLTVMFAVATVVVVPGVAAGIDCDAEDLAAAVTAANADPDTSTIELAAGCTYELAEPLDSITEPLVLEGNGATITRSDDAEAFRFLFAPAAPDLTVRDTTFVGGDAGTGLGGAISTEDTANLMSDPAEQQGSVTLERVVVRDSVAQRGGAIHSGPSITLTVLDSTFADNAAGVGGAVSILGSTASIDGTTFDGNAVASSEAPDSPSGPAGFGGALLAVDFRGMPAAVTVTNSTFTGNVASSSIVEVISGNPFGFLDEWQPGATAAELQAADEGEAATVDGTFVRLVHSTVTNSSTDVPEESGAVGGFEFVVWEQEGPMAEMSPLVHLQSTIVADQADAPDCAFAVASEGHNLDSDGSCPLDQDSDVPEGDAGLAELATLPGAATATHELTATSEAVDAAGAPCAADVAVDQLGRARPVGAGCDIGASESPKATVGFSLRGDGATASAASRARPERPGTMFSTAAFDEAIEFTVQPALGGSSTVTLRDGESFRAEGQPAGTYTVTAELPPGWSADAVSCDDPTADSDTDAASAAATIVAGFEQVDCDFVLSPPAPPTVDAGGPYRTTAGEAVELTATPTRGTGQVTGVAWTTDAAGCDVEDDDTATPSVTCTRAGDVEVEVEVRDEFGLTASDTATVEVASAPSGTATPDAAADDSQDDGAKLPDTGGGAAVVAAALLGLGVTTVRRRDT